MASHDYRILFIGLLALTGCNMRQDQAGPNSSANKVELANMMEPVNDHPISSVPGAAPDNSQVEPRAPITRR